jgi:hypothetical protein
MAGERIEGAERMVALWNEGDIETWLDEIGPEFEFSPDPWRTSLWSSGGRGRT